MLLGQNPSMPTIMAAWQSLVYCDSLETKLLIMSNSTQVAGAITEQKCFLKCFELGYNVSKPIFDNARYDFILDTGDKLLKIQVKTSHWKSEAHDAFVFNCYSQHSTGNGNKRMKYTNKEIDFFMTERDGFFYLFPVPEVGMSQKILRLIPPATKNTNFSLAEDYLFEKVIATI